MISYRLLWVDDEIDLLKAHIIFLEKKGYSLDTATNGYDALELCQKNNYDLVLLDENMPGLSGLETLARIKEFLPTVLFVQSLSFLLNLFYLLAYQNFHSYGYNILTILHKKR